MPQERIVLPDTVDAVFERVSEWLSTHIGVDFDVGPRFIVGVARRGPSFCCFTIAGAQDTVKFTNLSGCVVLLLHFWRSLKQVIKPLEQNYPEKCVPFPPMTLSKQDVGFLVEVLLTQRVDVAQQSLQILASVAKTGSNNALIISQNFPGGGEWLLTTLTLKWRVLPVEMVHRMCELFHSFATCGTFAIGEPEMRNVEFLAKQFNGVQLRAAKNLLLTSTSPPHPPPLAASASCQS